MGAVVEFIIRISLQRREGCGIDAEAAQRFEIVTGQRHHTADIVIEHLDLYSGSGFFLQNFQNGIPEVAFFNDEILHKNEVLGAAQILQQAGKHGFAQREVFLLCIGVGKYLQSL